MPNRINLRLTSQIVKVLKVEQSEIETWSKLIDLANHDKSMVNDLFRAVGNEFNIEISEDDIRRIESFANLYFFIVFKLHLKKSKGKGG